MVNSQDPDKPDIIIENIWLFKYLGSLFRADGDQHADVKARAAMARQTAGPIDPSDSNLSILIGSNLGTCDHGKSHGINVSV